MSRAISSDAATDPDPIIRSIAGTGAWHDEGRSTRVAAVGRAAVGSAAPSGVARAHRAASRDARRACDRTAVQSIERPFDRTHAARHMTPVRWTDACRDGGARGGREWRARVAPRPVTRAARATERPFDRSNGRSIARMRRIT